MKQPEEDKLEIIKNIIVKRETVTIFILNTTFQKKVFFKKNKNKNIINIEYNIK